MLFALHTTVVFTSSYLAPIWFLTRIVSPLRNSIWDSRGNKRRPPRSSIVSSSGSTGILAGQVPTIALSASGQIAQDMPWSPSEPDLRATLGCIPGAGKIGTREEGLRPVRRSPAWASKSCRNARRHSARTKAIEVGSTSNWMDAWLAVLARDGCLFLKAGRSGRPRSKACATERPRECHRLATSVAGRYPVQLQHGHRCGGAGGRPCRLILRLALAFDMSKMG